VIQAAGKLRADKPELFEKALDCDIQLVGPEYAPTSATEFVEVLNRAVQCDMAGV
jgi:hypothetical protein